MDERPNSLSIRQQEGCILFSATSFNKFNVNKLEEVIKRNPKYFSGSSRIWNLHETSTTTAQNPKKLLRGKGVKQVNKCPSGERGILVTTCCILCTSGNIFPLSMIFPRTPFKAHMLDMPVQEH